MSAFLFTESLKPMIFPSMNQELRRNTTRAVTREMVHARTVELAVLAGRDSLQIHQRDYERAKHELTGESDFDRQQAVLEQFQG